MKVWLIQDGEPLPGIDPGAREWRCGILARNLAERGHAVIWWASTFDHSEKKFRYDLPVTINMKPGIELRLLHGPGYRSNKSLKRYRHHRQMSKTFANEMETSSKPDIIFGSIPTIELSEQAVRASLRWNIPALIDIRDAWPDHYLTLVPIALRRFFKLLLFWEFKRAVRTFKHATGLISISETYLSWALRYAERPRKEADGIFPMAYSDIFSEDGSDKIGRLQYEVYSKYGLERNDFLVSFIGSFTTSFDFGTVIKAAHILGSHYPRIKILLVGDGPEFKKVGELSRNTPNVLRTGWLDQQSIAAILNISSVGLAPYKSDTLISLPNKPFEYMAAGLPMLSSLQGELEELIQREQIGKQYRAENVGSLVDQIIWLADHPGERQEMGSRARKVFEERYKADVVYPKLVQHMEFVETHYKGKRPLERSSIHN